jgi:hypothetical protein
MSSIELIWHIGFSRPPECPTSWQIFIELPERVVMQLFAQDRKILHPVFCWYFQHVYDLAFDIQQLRPPVSTAVQMPEAEFKLCESQKF